MQGHGNLVIILVATSGLLLLARLAAEKTAFGRTWARTVYAEPSGLPYFLRMAPASSPIVAAWVLVIALGLVLTPAIGRPVGVAGMTLVLVTFLIGYRCPPPLLPGWMRREIEAGTMPLARPDRIDWVLFWVVAPMAVLMPIGGLILLIVEHRL